jgi:hypothetical protein
LRTIGIAAALSIAFLIARNGVNMRYFDEWSYTGIFRQVRNGDYSGIWSPHNESRQPVNRALVVILAWLFHGDVRAEMFVSWLIACITSFNLWILGTRTLKTPMARAVCWALASLLVFSPLQYENWFWGNQMGLFIPFACLSGALAIPAKGELRIGGKITIAGLCLIATFSFACGMLMWIVMTPWIWRNPQALSTRNVKTIRIAWLALIALTAFLYFHGLDASGDLHDEWLRHPFATMEFFLAFLGNALTELLGIPVAATYGAGIVLLMILVVFQIARERHESEFMHRIGPWLAVLVYGLLVAAQGTVGRFRLGMEAALFSRYVTFGIIPLIALVHIISQFAERRNVGLIFGGREAILLAVLFVFNLGYMFVRSADPILRTRVIRLRGQAALEYIEIAYDSRSLYELIPHDVDVKSKAEDLDDLGLMHPGLVDDPHVSAGAISRSPDSGEYSIRQIELGGINLIGQARIGSDPAAAVALAHDDARGVPVIFRVIPVGYGESTDSDHWKWTLQPLEIPPGRITAWTIDARTAELHPMRSLSTPPK